MSKETVCIPKSKQNGIETTIPEEEIKEYIQNCSFGD